jgi:hypothetical protein
MFVGCGSQAAEKFKFFVGRRFTGCGKGPESLWVTASAATFGSSSEGVLTPDVFYKEQSCG